MRSQRSVGLIALLALSASFATAEASAGMERVPTAISLQRSEPDIVAGLMSNSKTGLEDAATYVLEHPASVNPLYFAHVANILWERGDRLQAVFWFYLFQIRSRPWADQLQDQAYTPARASLNATLGPMMNEWVGSDVDAWFEVASRAASYEKKAPLYAGRPEGLSESEWTERLQRRRDQNERDLNAVFSPMRADPGAVGASRRSNGLYVGPLRDAGARLPEAWR